MKSFRQKTISGLKWSALEHLASQGIAFVINLIIARILVPSDFGIIGLIAVFIGVSQVIINAGFAAALIRKQDRTQADLSTVFYYNLAAAIVLYLLLFFAAPWIAAFYKMPILVSVARVAGLNMIIASLSAIHATRLAIAVNFKTLTKVSLSASLLSGALGIGIAVMGYRVWALVFQSLAATSFTTILLWYFVPWRPSLLFSRQSFHELFHFGSKLMLSGLLDTLYNNIYQMIIGKKYSVADLGYFTRAMMVVQLPSNNITEVIQRVTFPVLSEMQHDLALLKRSYQQLLRMSALVIFPIMAFLIALASPLVKLILTDKWLPSVPLIQVLCLGFMFYPVHAINLNLLKVKGRPDVFLRLEVIKKVIITIVLIATVPFGLLAMCVGTVFTSIIALFINTYYTGKIIQHGFLQQMNDLKGPLLLAVLAGIAAFVPSFYWINPWIQLVAGGIAGSVVLLLCASWLKVAALKDVKAMLLKR